MTNTTNITIQLHLHGNHISSSLVIETLQAVEDTLHKSDKEDIKKAIKQLDIHPKIKQIITKRAKKKLQKHYGHRAGFTNAADGSIVLTGVVSAAAYFILKDILKDLLKDSWEESKLYNSLKEYFASIIDKKTVRIVSLLDKKTKKNKEYGSVDIDKNSLPTENKITIHAHESFYIEEQNFPSWEQTII